MNKQFSFSGLLENNTFLIALSLITAVVIWFGVVSEEKEAPAKIRNVPVYIDVEDSALERLELQPVNESAYAVDVDITGTRSAVGSVSPEDLKIVARLDSVNAAGSFNLILEGYDINNKGIVIKDITPDYITMRFDHFVEETLPIELVLEGLNIPEGYILNQEIVYPQMVTVTGPATEMQEVYTATATLTFDKPLSQTASYNPEIKLKNKNGEEIAVSTTIKLSEDYTSVTLPVLKKKNVPVTLDFINVPAGFDLDSIKYEISPEDIELAGPVTTINSLKELHLGYIDMETLEPGISLYYPIPLPPGYIAVDGTQDISVDFEGFNYDERLLDVSDIRIINAPSDYNITVQTKTIYGVTVFGPENQLIHLTSADLLAQIDMSQVDIHEGTATVPVSILIPGAEKCWAYGSGYTIVITATEK